MSNNRKSNFPTFLLTGAGLGFIYIILRNRFKILSKIRQVCDLKNPLRNQKVHIVETIQECKIAVNKLKRDCSKYKVLGFDCEWTVMNGSPRPVALLQLASNLGYCVLFRLCHLKIVPKELRDLLEDETILKAGIVPYDDAKKLSSQYGVNVASTLDLRFLAVKAGYKAEGLGGMTKMFLDIELDKHWRVSCSDWEATVLSQRQIRYAANDAHAAVEIFNRLFKKLVERRFWQSQNKQWQQMLEICDPFLDIKYFEGFLSKRPRKQEKSNECKNFLRKDLVRGVSKNSKRYYDNCLLLAPDDEVLCTCDKKKALWYINQNLAELITEKPLTARLNFEPAGRSTGEDGKYYTTPKKNQCVVCGNHDCFIRKNVVPREYRKFFPDALKSHMSHDVLLLCPRCHQISNISDVRIKQKLAELYTSSNKSSNKFVESSELRNLRSAARALLFNSERIPEERKVQLIKKIRDNYPNEEDISNEILVNIANTNILKEVDNYASHGDQVVQEFKKRPGGLLELEKIWREHFIKTMKPKFLPEFWSASHSINRYKTYFNKGDGRSDNNFEGIVELV